MYVFILPSTRESMRVSDIVEAQQDKRNGRTHMHDDQPVLHYCTVTCMVTHVATTMYILQHARQSKNSTMQQALLSNHKEASLQQRVPKRYVLEYIRRCTTIHCRKRRHGITEPLHWDTTLHLQQRSASLSNTDHRTLS